MVRTWCEEGQEPHSTDGTNAYCPKCGVYIQSEQAELIEVLDMTDSPVPTPDHRRASTVARASTVLTTPTRGPSMLRASQHPPIRSGLSATGQARTQKNLEVRRRDEEKRPRNHGSTTFSLKDQNSKYTVHITCIEEPYYYKSQAAKDEDERTVSRLDSEKQPPDGELIAIITFIVTF